MRLANRVANPVAARAALCVGALALSAAAACRSKSDATSGNDSAAGGTASGTAGGAENGTVAGGHVSPTSSVTAPGNTGNTGYVGTIQPVAMRAFNGNVQDAVAGREVFLRYNCYGCHGGLAGGAMGPSLRDDEWKYGGTDAAILNTLHNGRPGGMPAWKGVIPEPQLRQLVVYIRSMRSPQEPTFFFGPNDTTRGRTAFLVSSGGSAQGGTTAGAGGQGRDVQGGAPTPGQPGSASPATSGGTAGRTAGAGGR